MTSFIELYICVRMAESTSSDDVSCVGGFFVLSSISGVKLIKEKASIEFFGTVEINHVEPLYDSMKEELKDIEEKWLNNTYL